MVKQLYERIMLRERCLEVAAGNLKPV